MRIKKCSVIGLGKLGACMAVSIASKGFKVVGVDKNSYFVSAFNRKRSPILEPNLQGLLARYSNNITATSDYKRAIFGSEITFVIVPTPSDSSGWFTLSYVNQAVTEIGKVLAEKHTYHTVVITSTVLPGSMDAHIKPLLERKSGKICGKDFGLCYNPEFIALGTVIQNFLNPNFVLVGESDKKTGRILEDFYKDLCDNNPPVARMNFVNAELAKISVNSFITTKITFANMIAEMAEKLPGGDVDVITSALGLDSRIGKRYLKGGLGYGGPCFPRDNAALGSVAKKMKIKADIPMATDKFNHRIVDRLFKIVCSNIKERAIIGVLGLSYKPLSNVTEESQSVLLVKKLLKKDIKVIVYDPLAMKNLKKDFGAKINYAKSARSLIVCSDTIVIANPDPEFLKLNKSDFLKIDHVVTIIDCWRILRKLHIDRIPRVEYIPLGIETSYDRR